MSEFDLWQGIYRDAYENSDSPLAVAWVATAYSGLIEAILAEVVHHNVNKGLVRIDARIRYDLERARSERALREEEELRSIDR